jgi:hypothetical protein
MKSDLPKGLATPPTPFPPPYAVDNPFYGVTNRYVHKVNIYTEQIHSVCSLALVVIWTPPLPLLQASVPHPLSNQRGGGTLACG